MLLAAALMAAPAHAQTLGQNTVPSGHEWTEEWVASADGTRLHVDLLLPENRAPDERLPVLLAAGPYFSHSSPTGSFDTARHGPVHSPLLTAADVWKKRYAVAYADMRGFGASEGCVDFGGDSDRADALALIRWGGAQPWSSGRVVLVGRSGSGIPPVAALADPPDALAGVVVIAPSSSWYGTRYMGGVHYEGISHTISLGYDGYALAPGSAADKQEYHEGWARGLRPDCWSRHEAEQLDPDPSRPYWQERDLARHARGSNVPVLAAQGLRDSAAKQNNFFRWWSELRGPRAAWIGQFDHDSPASVKTLGRDGFVEQFSRFVAAVFAGEAVPRGDRGVFVQEAPSGRWRHERLWPPRGRGIASLDLLRGSFDDVPGNRSEKWDPAEPGNSPLLTGSVSPVTGAGTWTFSPPLDADLHVAGRPGADVEAAGPADANLIGLLYDVAPDGTAHLISRGATRLPSTRLPLLEQDYRVPAGHRVGLLISGADELWWNPLTRTAATVRVTGGALRLPVLSRPRDRFVDGGRGTRLDRHGPIRIDPDLLPARTSPMRIDRTA